MRIAIANNTKFGSEGFALCINFQSSSVFFALLLFALASMQIGTRFEQSIWKRCEFQHVIEFSVSLFCRCSQGENVACLNTNVMQSTTM